MRLTVLLLLAVVTSTVMAAPEIALTANPPLPVANLFANSGLEAGGEHPEGWGVAASQPDIVDFTYHKEGGYAGRYLTVEARGSTSNGYLSQPLHVDPDTLYRAGIWVRLRGGTCVVWLHAWVNNVRFDERAYLYSYGSQPTIPDFLDLAWTNSPNPMEWVWVGREFRTWKDQSNVNPHFGAFFDRSSLDLDEPFLGLARTELSLTVTGEAVRQVTVTDERGKCHWDSGVLPQPPLRLEHKLPELPTDTRYQVKVITAAGEEVSRWYPEAQ